MDLRRYLFLFCFFADFLIISKMGVKQFNSVVSYIHFHFYVGSQTMKNMASHVNVTRSFIQKIFKNSKN